MKKGLSPRQRHAASLLASGYTSRKTAEALQVTCKTLSQWNARADFRLLVDQLLLESQAEAIRAISGLSVLAAERLSELLNSENESIAQRAIEAVLTRRSDVQIPAMPSGTSDAWASILARIKAYESTTPTDIQ